MDVIFILFLVVIIWGAKPMMFNDEYIGRETTTAIKGIFAVLILFNHSRQYLPPPVGATCCRLDNCGMSFDSTLNFLGQLIVVMFLVYSGFGIMESYRRKRQNYLNGFLKRRVLKTLIHFDVAVCLFAILALWFGHQYSLERYLLSFTGWLSIGNSNWFIFDIIILYILSYIGLVAVEKFGLSEKKFLWLIFVFCCVFLIIMLKAKGDETWWYDTILAFPIGMLWSVYRTSLEKRCHDSRTYWLLFGSIALLFICFYCGGNYKIVFSFFAAPLFGLLVILFTMKFKIGNRALHWLGINAFSIYILQRIAMIVAKEYGFNETPLIFMLVVIPATLLIAAVFTLFTGRLDRYIFRV